MLIFTYINVNKYLRNFYYKQKVTILNKKLCPWMGFHVVLKMRDMDYEFCQVFFSYGI